MINDNTANNINKTIILIIACLSSFLTPFLGSSVNIALPTIARELSVNAISLSWITTAFFLTSAMFAVPFGKIADIYGMKKVFKYGVLIFVISNFIAAASPSVEILIVARALQGLGGAMIFVTGLGMITSSFPPEQRGKAIGMNVTAVYLGPILGPTIGGLLTHYISWRSIFYISGFLGLLIIVLTLWKLKDVEWATCTGEKLDYLGSLIYILMLSLILFGFSNITKGYGLLLIIIGIILLIVFILLELRVNNPVLEIKLFLKNRRFAFSNLATVISFTGLFSIVFLLSLYLQYIKGFKANIAGIFLIFQPIFMIITAPIAGRLSDKYDPGKISSIGMGFMTIAMVLLSLMDKNTSIYYIIISLAILGTGVGIFSAPNTNAIMGSVERKYYGVASATVSTMRLIGQTLSMGIILLIFAIYMGANQITPSNYPTLLTSIHIILTISVILSVLAIFASLARTQRKEG
jgi:EmrB/QacA subfamily drug resistance transporter